VREADGADHRRKQEVSDTVRAHGPDIQTQYMVQIPVQFLRDENNYNTDKEAVMNGLLGWPLKVTVGAHQGLAGNWKCGRGRPVSSPNRFRQVLTTTCGLVPRLSSHTFRIEHTALFAATGTMTAADSATWECITLIQFSTYSTRTRTSPVEVEADTQLQDSDAALPWRRVRLKYADGCEIILDGDTA